MKILIKVRYLLKRLSLGIVGYVLNKVFEFFFDEVVGVVDCLVGKEGSGNGVKVGIVGMFFVFVFFFRDCFLGIIEKFFFMFEFLF